jgi:mannosyltransferase
VKAAKVFSDSRFQFWGILLLSGLARLIKLGSQPIAYDEAFSLIISGKSLTQIVEATVGDVHPPLYYFLLHGWLEIFGNSPAGARVLSVAFGMLTVWIAFELGKLLLGNKRAWLPALLVGLSTYQVHYAREIRMYSLLGFALLLATYGFLRGMRQGGWVWWCVFALGAALAQYAHSLSVFYLIPLALIPVFRWDPKNIRNTLLAGIAAVGLYLPWLIHITEQFGRTSNYWIPRPELFELIRLVQIYLTDGPRFPWVAILGFPIAILVIVFGVIRTARSAQQEQKVLPGPGWMLYLAFAMPVFLWVFSLWRPLYLPRAFIASGILFLFWLSLLIVDRRTHQFERLLLVSAVVISFAAGTVQYFDLSGFPTAPFEELGEYLNEVVDEDSVVVHSNRLSFLPLYYFEPDLKQDFIGIKPESVHDSLSLETQDVFGVQQVLSMSEAVGDAHRVYLIIFDLAMEMYFESEGAPHPDIVFFEENNYRLESKTLWDELWLYEYVRD